MLDCFLIFLSHETFLFSAFCSFQSSPCEDRNFRSDIDDTETEEASISGQEDLNDLLDILEWAKVCSLGYIRICLFFAF